VPRLLLRLLRLPLLRPPRLRLRRSKTSLTGSGKTLKWLGFLLSSGALALSLGCSKGKVADEATLAQGKTLFEAYCASCHKDGGNVVNPQKTLFRRDREANGIKSPDDIINVMRNPGSGMPRLGRDTLPDDKASAVAQYVFSTF